MKTRIKKALGIAVAAIVALPLAGLAYLYAAFPKVPPPSDVKVQATPALVERGAYLANSVAICMDCHTTRDWTRFSGPTVPGTHGKGGERFGPEIGLPGTLYASNITPAALGDWSDGELIRAITTGVSKDGRALFPLMPYPAFGSMCERDVNAIVAYLRTLPAIENEVPLSTLDFPLNLIVRTLPAPASPQACPSPEDGVAYGAYLTKMAACVDCHTKSEAGTPLPGMQFAGGVEFPLPTGGVVRTANLTPDVETGLGAWTKQMFVARFRAHADPSAEPGVGPGQFNTVMPWTQYGTMTEQDLGAIYDYLRTLAPVNNRVERFTPPEARHVAGSPKEAGELARAK